MRDHSAAELSALAGTVLNAVWFIQIELPPQDLQAPGIPGPIYRLHTGVGPINHPQLGLFEGRGDVGRFDPVREEPGMREAGLRVELPAFDPNTVDDGYSALVSAMVSGLYRGGRVSFWRVLLNSQHEPLGAVPDLRYRGFMASREVRHTADGVVLAVTLHNRNALFDERDRIIYAHEGHIAKFPGDNFFLRIHETHKTLNWGGVSTGPDRDMSPTERRHDID